MLTVLIHNLKIAWRTQISMPFLSFLDNLLQDAYTTLEKVYFRSQILECTSIGEYWNISGVPIIVTRNTQHKITDTEQISFSDHP